MRNTDEMTEVFDAAEDFGPLRALVHCAGRGGAVRLVNKDGTPGSLETYTDVVVSTSLARSMCCDWARPGWLATKRWPGTAASAC